MKNAGLEDLCVVERKDLSDLVRSFTIERPAFVVNCTWLYHNVVLCRWRPRKVTHSRVAFDGPAPWSRYLRHPFATRPLGPSGALRAA